jgi:hypothetical protein
MTWFSAPLVDALGTVLVRMVFVIIVAKFVVPESTQTRLRKIVHAWIGGLVKRQGTN